MTLTQERLKELLDYDPETGVFTNKARRSQMPAGAIAGARTSDGYWQLWLDGKVVKAHRAAWLYVYGLWPKQEIDHIDGDPLNNRIANLRDVPPSINMWNQHRVRKNNTSGYTGVSWHKATQRYRATIRMSWRTYHIGYFGTPEEARDAYLDAKRRRQDEDAL